jgi:galactofuranose transport system permease protein
MFFARGMAFVVHPRSLGIKHPFFVTTVPESLAIPLGGGLSLPLTASIFLLALAAGVFIAQRTPLGRWVYAVGGDEHGAGLMGVRVGRTKAAVYAIAGFCSALAGVVYTFYTQSGDPASCVGFELDVIAAVVIGGTMLTGGVGTVAGSALGTMVLGLIQTLINFQGTLSSWWTRIAIGLLLLVFISLQHAAGRVRRLERPLPIR